MTEVQKTADYIRTRIKVKPRIMIVLGSGLGSLGDEIDDAVRIAYGEIPGFHASNVVGHKGMLVAGKIEGVEVIAMQGRFHMYEGHTPQVSTFPIRVMAALGADTLIVSNAAGAVNTSFQAGDLMLIEDHINFMFQNPLIGPLVEGDIRFPDMTFTYDRELRAIAQEVAKEQGLELQRGVYLAGLGPSYETPAEIKVFALLGADAVGMSTVPEVIVARTIGVRVLGISLISNPAAGLSGGEPLDHVEVLAAAEAAGPKFVRLVKGIIPKIK